MIESKPCESISWRLGKRLDRISESGACTVKNFDNATLGDFMVQLKRSLFALPLVMGLFSFVAQASENIHCRSGEGSTIHLEMSAGKLYLKEGAAGQPELLTPSKDYSVVWHPSEVVLEINSKSRLLN